MYAIHTENLTKIYQNRLIAVNGLNLSVEAGAVFGLLGPNGAGKTTTIKLLLGLQQPTAGRVELFGERMAPGAAHLRQRIGYLPTTPRFPPAMTPITYLDFIGQLFGLPRQVRKPRLASLIRAVGLLPAQSQVIKSFSTGMMTRLGIAASLINEPDLLIWDEPTAGLDPAARKYTLDLIKELGRTRTVVLSSHILSDIDQVCDQVGVLYEGKLIFQGSISQFKQRLGRSRVELELEGDEVALAALRERLGQLPEVVEVRPAGLWWEIRLRSADSLAGPLSQVLGAAGETRVQVRNVVTTKGQTEEAFIQLLEKDQAHGFTRVLDGSPAGPPALPPLPDSVERADAGGSDHPE